jgi:protein-S-isoprenylcysteine O-methyltransferase Ste14
MDPRDALEVNQAVGSLWALWVVSWIVAGRWTARTVKTTRPGERTLERLLTIAGAIMVISPRAPLGAGELSEILYSPGSVLAWFLVALVACGFAFCWWARIHLGRMWSANITLKEEHRIIDTGPYALVRHPIYSGLLLSAWASAAIHGNSMGFLGAALMTLGFYLKARREEQLLITELGAAYESYLRRVPMLFPFSMGGG